MMLDDFLLWNTYTISRMVNESLFYRPVKMTSGSGSHFLYDLQHTPLSKKKKKKVTDSLTLGFCTILHQ